MRYELQHIDDCPHWKLAHDRLREALIATGHGDAAVSVRTVRDPGDAEPTGFLGSPSIFADGVDLFPGSSSGGAMTCRVYPTPIGLAGSPTVEQFIAAIEERDAAGVAACSCCGRSYPRSKVHSLHRGSAYICRRCGLWVALRWRGDRESARR